MNTKPAHRFGAAAVGVALLTAVLAGTGGVAHAGTSAPGPAREAAACEFPTWQYRFIGQDGTWRSEPGGTVRGYWQGGDLFNTGLGPSHSGWLVGNVYTWDGVFKGHGYVLRDYLTYVRNWC